MTKREYASKVLEILEAQGINAEIKEVTKDNENMLGVVIKNGDVCPTLYIDTNVDINEFVENLKALKPLGTTKEAITRIMSDKNEILSRVKLDMYNEKLNMNMNCVKKSLNNGLMLIARVDVDDLVSNGHIKVTDEIMKIAGITKDELFAAARRNTNADGYEITDFVDYMEKQGTPASMFMPRGIMAIITNKKMVNGAVAILNDGVEEELRNIIGEFYVLPSSRHEMIAVTKENADIETVKMIVNSVNREVVENSDYLSDDVFELYDGKLFIA